MKAKVKRLGDHRGRDTFQKTGAKAKGTSSKTESQVMKARPLGWLLETGANVKAKLKPLGWSLEAGA